MSDGPDEHAIRQTQRKRLVGEYAEIWLSGYNQFGVVKDEAGRVSAANGMMVTMDKAVPFIGAPIDTVPQFTRADKISEATKPATPPTQEKLSEEGLIGPAYDPVNKRWNYCPKCKTTDIDHVSQEKGKEYQGCFNCRIYLNIDEKTVPMPPKRSR